MKTDDLASGVAEGGGHLDERLAREAAELAGRILETALREQKAGERYHGWKLNRMLGDPNGKAFVISLADQIFRPQTPERAASQFRHLMARFGAPAYLPLHERAGLLGAAAASRVAPELVMSAVAGKMRAETRKVVLPDEDLDLRSHMKRRRAMGARLILNVLGEAVLGEEEAERRLEANMAKLRRPDCDAISIKVSSIFSQVNVLAYEDTLERLKAPLRKLFRAARDNVTASADGSRRSKFVNLDMEEYRDLRLTSDVFRQILDEDEFRGLEAGIVLQAYLPDAFPMQRELTDWAVDRVSRGGAPIRIRLVKGANLATERVEAAVHGWAPAPYRSKAEVDANFKRMLHYACRPEHAEAVRVGVGTHNLFDVAYALVLREREGVAGQVGIEMLEGMANHQARAVEKLAGGVLFYAPVVKRENFDNAIAYLVRRLDENSAPQNFLHDLFGMRPGDGRWAAQRERFLRACRERHGVSSAPSRRQDRRREAVDCARRQSFGNAPDTDWSLECNREWVAEALRRRGRKAPDIIPLQIGGRVVVTGDEAASCDPSRPEQEFYRYHLAGDEEVDEALAVAVSAARNWAKHSILTPRELLIRAAGELARRRGELIATMVSDGGKTVPEADAEVSEAIDFANYYATGMSRPGMHDGTAAVPLGAVVVAPPWNFPLAIPCGGVLAALGAGNAVILKPAPETVLTAWELAKGLWAAGVPKRLLQFVPCPENEAGRRLLTDPRTDAVILTGAHDTARLFKGWKPEMRLFGETSGKNAILITAAADPEQAVRDLVKSAFGHAGQKCSAASLAIVEAELYDDPRFMRQLRDAAASLRVGAARDPASVVTPVIRTPGKALRRALHELDAGEEWLLRPEMADGNPCLWSPGIRKGVGPEAWFRRTECFGPVLGLVRAASFEEGLRMQNDSEFGLTGGLQSLDEREISRWREAVETGNAYINRPITGAMVQRQPFGGWRKSGTGPGAKAGGPNYVLQLARWREEGLPSEGAAPSVKTAEVLDDCVAALPESEARLRAGARSYAKWWEEEFSREHDPSGVLGEANCFRYRPHGRVLVRGTNLEADDAALVLLASRVCGTSLAWSVDRDNGALRSLARKEGIKLVVEPEDEFANRLRRERGRHDSLRAPKASPAVHRAANEIDLQVIDWPVLANGRIELLHYLKEQSVSETLHRYGNIVRRAR